MKLIPKQKKIIITIFLSLLEIVIFMSFHHKINFEEGTISFLSQITPMGILCFLNYYILSPILYIVMLKAMQLFGKYKHIISVFSTIVSHCTSWLAETNTHWGVVDTAIEAQHANTCEGIIAIQKSKLTSRYSSLYEKTLTELFSEVTDQGLSSKSLGRETVVCTSMILYIFALDQKEPTSAYNNLKNKFENIAQNLWNNKSENGWGVFIEKANKNYCSIVNTFWALRALNEYPSISQSEEFYLFIRQIYELSYNSLFGYNSNDCPRLIATSMSILLYYSLDPSIQVRLDDIYSVDIAIKYVYKQFCHKKIEFEMETLLGTHTSNSTAKKAPWTHICIAYSIEALTFAYQNKRINFLMMNILIGRIKKMCKSLVYINNTNNKCYYIPKGIQNRHDGVFTYPTAYFIWGLSALTNTLKEKR